MTDDPDPYGAHRLAAWLAEHKVGGNGNGQPSPSWDGAPPDTRQQAYLSAALRNEAARVASSSPGERNNRLNKAAYSLGGYVSGAGLDEQVVTDTLTNAADQSGLTADDGISSTEDTIRSGLQAGMANPRAVPPPDEEQEVEGDGERGDPEEEEDFEFWSQTDELTHVHAFARSRAASPYATLGKVLRRAVGCIEPYVVLPPTIGGQVSLNLFTASVGASGVGKDIANDVGDDAVTFGYRLGGDAFVPHPDAYRAHPGTGEGLARIFAGRGKRSGETRAHLQVRDIGTLEALAGRRGQTLVGQLLAAYMGQELGFSNNAKDTCTPVEPHAYRLCLSVGVQPENAGFFLSRESHGFPQRFLWLPTIDPGAPRERPDPVGPLEVELPDFPQEEGERFEMSIPDAVAKEIWLHRWRVLTGVEGIDPLDGHLKLTQLKVAAGVAILHRRNRITDLDWQIAGQLIMVSTKVRTGLLAVVEAQRRRENTAKAHAQADRQATVEELLADDHQRRVRRAIERKLRRVGTAAEYELLDACDSSIRGDFKFVFDLCLSDGFIVCCEEGGDDRALRYRLG
jgi:hypothetical protein